MIYVGYAGIGKSSIAGNGNIDLESNNFRIGERRHNDWHIVYCNIIENLSKQGYNVFISAHTEVRDELKKRGLEFVVITPALELEDAWIKRLQDRYERTGLDKDKRALMGSCIYRELVNELMQEDNVIVIESTDYDLRDLIERK